MTKTETMKDTIIPVNKMKVDCKSKKLPFLINLKILSPLAPNIVGIPKKKENSAATYLEAPIRIPPRIVAPEREVPGINAKTWKTPIIIAAL